MSKAILILDKMPDKCNECPLHEMSCNFDNHLCVPIQKEHYKFAKKKPDWCPLREIPRPREIVNNYDDYLNGLDVGYNDCIYEMIGYE